DIPLGRLGGEIGRFVVDAQRHRGLHLPGLSGSASARQSQKSPAPPARFLRMPDLNLNMAQPGTRRKRPRRVPARCLRPTPPLPVGWMDQASQIARTVKDPPHEDAVVVGERFIENDIGSDNKTTWCPRELMSFASDLWMQALPRPREFAPARHRQPTARSRGRSTSKSRADPGALPECGEFAAAKLRALPNRLGVPSRGAQQLR